MLWSKDRLAAYSVLVSVSLTAWGCCSGEKAAGVVLVGLRSSREARAPAQPTKATIHVSKGEQLIWKAAPGGRLTSVSISLGGHQPPFGKCGAADPCVISCDPDDVCVSGPIRDGLNPPRAGLYYEYSAAFAAGEHGDPGFIIKP